MLKVKGGAGGGGSKSKSRGVGGVVIRKETKLESKPPRARPSRPAAATQTSPPLTPPPPHRLIAAAAAEADKLVVLRAALRDAAGDDRDVLADFPSFVRFDRNGLAAELSFTPGGMRSRLLRECVAIARANTEEVADACGYGWDDSEKRAELKAREARVLLIHEAAAEGDGDGEEGDGGGDGGGRRRGELLGFVHFRFTLDGELFDEPGGDCCLILYDVQLAERAQGKGLGRHIMLLVELMARKWRMPRILVPMLRGTPSRPFFMEVLRGYAPDAAFCDDQQEVLSKAIAPPRVVATAASREAAELAAALAAPSGAAPASPPAKEASTDSATAASPDAVTGDVGGSPAKPLTKAQRKRLKMKAKKQAKRAAQAASSPDSAPRAPAVAPAVAVAVAVAADAGEAAETSA